MPCKLRYSLTALAVIALVAAFGSSAAQAQYRLKNAIGATNTTNMRPWTTTHAGSNRPAQPGKYVFTTTPDPTSAKGYIGRNDGYVQQSSQGAANRFHPTKQYGVQVGWGERSQAKGLATKGKGSQAPPQINPRQLMRQEQ